MILEKHILDMFVGIAAINPATITAALKDAKKYVLNDGTPKLMPC